MWGTGLSLSPTQIPEHGSWQVADDCGRTWETNWVMDFTPAEGGPE